MRVENEGSFAVRNSVEATGGLRQTRHKSVLFRYTSNGTLGTWDAHRMLLGPTPGEKPVAGTDSAPRVALSVIGG
jgi:hypothetical protein